MKFPIALPVVLALFSKGVTSLHTVDEALDIIAAKQADLSQKMQGLAPLIEKVVATLEPYDDKSITNKWDHLRILKVWINDYWKAFNLLEQLEIVLPVQKSDDFLDQIKSDRDLIINLRNTFCPPDRPEVLENWPKDTTVTPKQCMDRMLKAEDYFKAQLDLVGDEGTYRMRWQFMAEFLPFKVHRVLRRMVEKKMTNNEWLKWFAEELEGISPENMVKIDDITQTELKLKNEDWGFWSRTCMLYERPDPPPQNGRVEYPTEEEKSKAETFVRQRMAYKYHYDMVSEFIGMVSQGFPDTSAVTKQLLADIQALRAANGTPQQEKDKKDSHFRTLKNAPKRDRKFFFKKAKGLDAKLAVASNHVYVGDESDLYNVGKVGIKSLRTIIRSQDPKLHPSDKDDWISDALRLGLRMKRRMTFQPPAKQNPQWDPSSGSAPKGSSSHEQDEPHDQMENSK